MRLMSASIVAGLAAALCASAASAAVININNGDSDYGSIAYTGLAGAPDSAGAAAVWNSYNANPTNTSRTLSLVDSFGAATPVTYTTTFTRGYVASRNGLISSLINETSPQTFTLTGLNVSTSYDLYFYSYGGGANTTNFTVGATTVSPLSTPTASTSIVASDWAMMTVNSSGTGTITGTVAAATGDDWGRFNGMQIVVPEPASLGLLSLAGIALMRRRRA